MVDTYVYLLELPKGINEMVVPCADSAYTIYINERLCDRKRNEAFRHAVRHIVANDFEMGDVQQIETEAHRR